ncbi:hypothetical protein MA16_Dca024449 [Dendrobium catenatum]|uniref:Uncharacterized protein n=1 Tax=Dendrobium catenatum TaxID=906689 RepID=A0A2I0WRD7_9ASPA|nr:hypothetical protein MA16_Dca024449 [Dendrobium catenatum]
MATVAATTAATVLSRGRVRASWDTNPSPKPLKIPKFPKPSPSFPATSLPVTAAVAEKPKELHLSDFFNSGRNRAQIGLCTQRKCDCCVPLTENGECNAFGHLSLSE